MPLAGYDLAMQQVPVQALAPDRFRPLVGAQPVARLDQAARTLKELLGPARVWNVNSTATGGGVAEMLQPLLAYARGGGIDARWLVVEGDAEFFRITKRLHNGFHGEAGDGGPLGPAEREHYGEVLRTNAGELAASVERGDIVLLHDPQTAGLVPAMAAAGAVTIWRSHIGSDRDNDLVERSWSFLQAYLSEAAALVFSRPAYVPHWLDGDPRVHVIAPSIDPFSAKNQDLSPATVRSVLGHTGIIRAEDRSGPLTFVRRDGSPGDVDHRADIVRAGPAPGPEVPLVVQVSRWDRLKDMQGLMEGFAEQVVTGSRAHLVLAGPNVTGVADDPEGVDVLRRCVDAWRELPDGARARVQLVCLPMADIEENAAIVNALQRHATVVVQKSLAEGFGLTVAEAMWKATPVVASAVGGILDQIVDGEHGLLLQDPGDHEELGRSLRRLLDDPATSERLGAAARRRVTERFLATRHLTQYADLIAALVDRTPPSPAKSF